MNRFKSILLTLWLIGEAASAKEGYRPPRVNGQVDMQGMWTNTSVTPLERPPEFKMLVVTADEAAQMHAKVVKRRDDLSKPAEPSLYFDTPHIDRIRGELRSSIIIEPKNGVIPGNALFKEKAAKARADFLTVFDGPEQRPVSERCLGSPTAAPPMQVIPANNLRQIVQTPDVVAIFSEEIHDARIIRLNSEHAPAAVLSWLGDSIGWWESDSLVVQTKHFAPTSEARMGPQHLFFVSPQTTVIERFTRTSENEIAYVFTVDDPTYYTQAWTGEARLVRTTDRMFESACHEGNYSLVNALLGGRAADSVGSQNLSSQNASVSLSKSEERKW